MAITAALVKELRETTGAGMMDCKKALSETDGNLEAAVDWLRTKGLAAAAKKAGRVAAEGLVGVAVDGTAGAVVELNSETDFVSRNEDFQKFVSQIASLGIVANGDIDALKATAFPGTSRNVEEQVTHMIATIGENMNLRRVASISVEKGVVASYVHASIAQDLGKIGVLVALESEADAAVLEALGKQIAMHIAATNPASATVADLDPELVEREKAVLTEQAKESGRPDEIIAKMIEGRIRKYYEQVVLLEQTFVIDGENQVKAVIEKAAKDAGTAITLKGFIRFELGDGIEKEEKDFAAEVAEQLKK
ncbi:translation elongation factor Ts [Thalassospira marina]|uniref:Elongation factor Ts n=1 Tax=Thalassospira marina TaxID=2048283 RepID=A0A2N3KC39_9PROT|nr:translation elongation factor Ts [Thalassospira marina]AUG53046.1 elongation factor Ts [Thalassospira marina]PKR48084.1 elongation factor Ts [Thalassospira marina]